MRLLTERLSWMDAQTRQLAAENEWLRRELDNSTRQIEVEARERAKEIVAELEAREATPADDVGVTREDLAVRVSELEGEARSRIDEIRARSAELEAPTEARLPSPEWPAPEGEPAAGLAPPVDDAAIERERDEREAELRLQRERADALEAEIEALLRLRMSVVESIRETLIGQAERLAEAERSNLTRPGAN